jgi:outer membrane immunogenic protein
MLRPLGLVLTVGALLGLAAGGAASAADLAVKARPMRAPATPWTGCYLGGNAGGGWSRVDTQSFTNALNYGRENDSGFLGGVQAGCDFQTTNLVFGVQGSFDFGQIKGRHALTDLPTQSETNSLKSLSTATGRIGYLFTPTFLGYAKGGMAWMQNKNQVFTPTGALLESASYWLPGMTAGGGVEWAFAPNWSVFAEYNYAWIEDQSGQNFTAEVLNVKQTVQTGLVGINYKFHWDGPIVAKY